MYWIDGYGDICYKSSIDRCYFLTTINEWIFFADLKELNKSAQDCIKINQISEKYRLLHNIPDFSLDNND